MDLKAKRADVREEGTLPTTADTVTCGSDPEAKERLQIPIGNPNLKLSSAVTGLSVTSIARQKLNGKMQQTYSEPDNPPKGHVKPCTIAADGHCWKLVSNQGSGAKDRA